MKVLDLLEMLAIIFGNGAWGVYHALRGIASDPPKAYDKKMITAVRSYSRAYSIVAAKVTIYRIGLKAAVLICVFALVLVMM